MNSQVINGIKSIDVYARDAVINWRVSGYKKDEGNAGYIADTDNERGKIDRLSERSLRRLAFVASNTAVDFNTLITLTYPGAYPSNGRVVKGHLNRFLSWLRSRGIRSYLWFVEFQKRGAPHMHILIDGWIDKHDVAERWYRAVGSNDKRHRVAGTRVEGVRVTDGLRNYVVKYATKTEQKDVPADYRNVGRFWGHSRDVKPEPLYTVDVPDCANIDDVMDLLGDWQYKARLAEGPLSTLYNASAYVMETLLTR